MEIRWYMNLQRRPDKSTYTRAMLTGVDCLLEDVHRTDVHDFRDYENIDTLFEGADLLAVNKNALFGVR